MSKLIIKAVVILEIDTDEYHIPADLRLSEQLIEDITEAVEENISAQVKKVIISKVKKIYEQEHTEEDYN